MFRKSRDRAAVRVLCHVNHYFGASSTFVGKSTAGDPAARVEIVTRALEGIQQASATDDLEIDVRVCGFPTESLVPVDLDLSHIGDPRHLVYESLARMLKSVDQYDYFLNIEDDILISPETIRRMMAFAKDNRVNEVLLPNRLEPDASGSVRPVDLEALPGWQGLSRSYRGHALDVAVNPHSGMLLLSAAQLRYAQRRVDFSRREQFIGGFMASAYANAHLPFQLWRTREDLQAHHVIHLDHWMGRDGAGPRRGGVALGPQPSNLLELQGVRGWVDDVSVDRLVIEVRGWGLDGSGSPLDIDGVAVGEHFLEPISVRSQERPDVQVVHPDAGPGSGFVARFSSLRLPPGWPDEPSLAVAANADGQRVHLAKTAWPIADVARGLQSAPEVPDRPHMPEQGVRRLRTLLRDANSYLEYGTGGTTVMAARAGVSHTTGVESDLSWMVALEERLRVEGLDERVTLQHVDIGPTGPWGVPTTDEEWSSYHRYPLAVWSTFAEGESPDVVLIDGRFRIASFLASLIHGRPGTRVLFDDYGDRPHYHVVERLLAPVAHHDRVAEFVIPDQVATDAAWALLVENLSDVT